MENRTSAQGRQKRPSLRSLRLRSGQAKWQFLLAAWWGRTRPQRSCL